MTQTQTQLITIIAAIIAIFEILQESTPNQFALATKPTHRQRRLKCPTQIKRERDGERGPLDATQTGAATAAASFGGGGGVMHAAAPSTTQSPIYGAITQNRIRSNKGRASERDA